MIRAMIVATALASTAPAQANNIELCAKLSQLASLIMDLRQNGLPMRTVLDKHASSDVPEFERFMTELTIAAYDQPAYSGDRYKQRAITEFGNTVNLQCLRDLK